MTQGMVTVNWCALHGNETHGYEMQRLG